MTANRSGLMDLLTLDRLMTGPLIHLIYWAGLGLLAIGVACWFASSDTQSCAARGVVSAMVIYNLGAALVLGAAGIQSPPPGIALWPAVILHAAQQIMHPPVTLAAWPSEDRRSRLVLIVRKLEPKVVDALWTAFLGQS